MRNPFAVAPPSARRMPVPIGSTSSTSATWWAIASSAARTRCARVVPRVRPEISPRASGSQCGEPSPVSAGTKWTPSVESTSRASRSLSAALRDHAEAVAQPLHAGAADEDGALGRELRRRPGRHGGGRLQQPLRRRSPRARPTFASTKVPVPYVAFTSPGAKQPWPNRAACWSPAMPASGTAAPSSSASATTPAEGTTAGRIDRGRPRRARAARRPSCPVSMSSSIVRDAFVTSVRWASPPVSFQASQESTVPKASSLLRQRRAGEDPLELRRREVGIAHEPGLLPHERRRGARRTAPRCGGPARRSRDRRGDRSRAPTRPSSRAGS